MESGEEHRGLKRWLNGLSPPGPGEAEMISVEAGPRTRPKSEKAAKEPSGERAQGLGSWALKQKAEGARSGLATGHILQKVHILPRATLALEILALGPKIVSAFLISHGEEGLSPRGSSLAWVPKLPQLILAQASMKETLVVLPQGFPEMSLPSPACPHSQPTKEYLSLPIP